jgi:hypothetical protein
MRKLSSFFRRRPDAPSLPQGFDVCLTLRKGEKVVRRNRNGEVEIVRLQADVTRLDASGDEKKSG